MAAKSKIEWKVSQAQLVVQKLVGLINKNSLESINKKNVYINDFEDNIFVYFDFFSR